MRPKILRIFESVKNTLIYNVTKGFDIKYHIAFTILNKSTAKSA
jgi:hypothetical protein